MRKEDQSYARDVAIDAKNERQYHSFAQSEQNANKTSDSVRDVGNPTPIDHENKTTVSHFWGAH